MRPLVALTLLSLANSLAVASEVWTHALTDDWLLIEVREPSTRYKDWKFQLWRNKSNGDLLIVAQDPIDRSLDSFADLDRAMDFATAAHPEWLNEPGYPNWRTENVNYEPRFLKLQKRKLRYKTAKTSEVTENVAIEYCMVNDDDKSPMMANGFVANYVFGTCYVQLTSKRPISDSLPREIVEQLHARRAQ